MGDTPQILTSNSAYGSYMKCPRARWWGYEALNAAGSRGWERKSLSLPLATGSWCHRMVQGLFTIALGGDMSAWLAEIDPEAQTAITSFPEVISEAVAGYLDEARIRGLDLGLQMNGSIPEEQLAERTIAEQAALLEAFSWAFLRVRLPRILEEYELVDVEREEVSLLSADVGLQGRCDAVLRRRLDQKLFIYNLKTSGNPDKRWQDAWQVDGQLMTETLAVERRLSERVYGVVIDGFDKGIRVQVDFQTLKERPKDLAQKWEAQRSRLIYGYKCEETVPGRPTLYDWEGTTRKGWEKFAVWEERFEQQGGASPVEYWVNWLPQEQVEAAFVTLPPIMREQRKIDSVVRQMVEQEARIRNGRIAMDATPSEGMLDRLFPQNFHSCVYPTRCAFYRLCHEEGAENPAAAGFQPRTSNHPEVE